ncbi:hypothetical protein [Citromicrobium sp. JLT1363]|uniref:hypothetical protein n=1 Tax=Citromicrobium sp. JLT1363 TaxID=517722 RepID=UPI000225E4CA|nr:hypothetical protein [Citromicrobium sp. JLT1363]
MSYDQKPSRIKLVSSGRPAGAPQNADALAPALEGANDPAQPGEQPARRAPVLPAILFLAGCAIGGAGLAAWPHLAS